MSILCTMYLKDGIILASESRATHSREKDGKKEITKRTDDLQKTFLINQKNIGISFCGNAKIKNIVLDDFFEEYVNKHVQHDDTVETIADLLYKIFRHNGTQVIVAGYLDDKPYVYKIEDGEISLLNRAGNEIIYGMEVRGAWPKTCAYFEATMRNKIVFADLQLEEGIKLVDELIKFAIDNEEGCGGEINILVIKEKMSEWK